LKRTLIKLANLERETILSRLLNHPGHFVKHKTERIILSVAHRFHDRRMQAAYERYCVILNQRDIRVRMDGSEPWRLLFTYRLAPPFIACAIQMTHFGGKKSFMFPFQL